MNVECLPPKCAIEMDELLARCVGNRAFAERILQRFAGSFAADLVRLEEFARSGNADETARLAHTLKGAAANVAAHGLQDRVARIEDLARGQRCDELSAQWAPLRQAWADVAQAIGEIVTSSGAPASQ